MTRRLDQNRRTSGASCCSATRSCWPCRCRSRRRSANCWSARLNADPSPYRYRVINAGVQGYGPGRGAALLRVDGSDASARPRHRNNLCRQRRRRSVAHRVAAEGRRSGVTARRQRHCGNPIPSSRPAEHGAPTAAAARRLCHRAVSWTARRARATAPELRGEPCAANRRGTRHHPAMRPRHCGGRASQGASTAIALMPARFQVDDADYGRLKEAVTAAGGELQRDAASQRFDAALAELPLPRVDLLPALRRALPGPDLFFQETVHLTPRGHEIVAEALYRFIEEQHLGTPDPRGRPADPWSSTRSTSSGSSSSSTRCTGCCHTGHRTGCFSSRATTSTRPGTGASSASSSPPRLSTTRAAV